MRLACIIFVLFLNQQLFSIAKDTTRQPAIIALCLGPGYNLGLADLGKRFPDFFNGDFGVLYKPSNAYFFGINYSPIFGSSLKDSSIFGGILGPNKRVLDANGNAAVIRYYSRGYHFNVFAGTSFRLITKKESFGTISVQAGIGMLQHRIKMKFDAGLIPQLEGDYMDGYDRLTNGMMLTQQIRYNYINTQSLSFYAGINFIQGFTQSRRNVDYNIGKYNGLKRNDFAIGLNMGLYIPILLNGGSKATEFKD